MFGFLVSHDLRNVDSVVGVEMWGEYKAGAGGLGRPPTRTTAHAPETTGFHTARQQAAANIFYLGATYKFPQNDRCLLKFVLGSLKCNKSNFNSVHVFLYFGTISLVVFREPVKKKKCGKFYTWGLKLNFTEGSPYP